MTELRRISPHTLLGRVHEQASLEARRDVAALYELLDPALRARRERERDDEPARTLAQLQDFVGRVTVATVEDVRICEATKRCARLGARPAALVESVVRYDGAAEPQRFRSVWVREAGVWYARAIGGIGTPAGG